MLLVGCATRPHTYEAPDQTKVVESTRQVKEGVRKSRAAAGEAKAIVQKEQERTDKLIVQSRTLAGKLDEIIAAAPEELKLPLEVAKSDLGELQREQEDLKLGLGNAWTKQNETEQHLSGTETRIAELENRQVTYYAEAQKLAATATEERNYRIAAEKQLSTQRWFGWLWKLGAFLLIGLVIAFFAAKALGKLGWLAAKIGLKATI
jgi:chromosome segregation ATPase